MRRFRRPTLDSRGSSPAGRRIIADDSFADRPTATNETPKREAIDARSAPLVIVEQSKDRRRTEVVAVAVRRRLISWPPEDDPSRNFDRSKPIVVDRPRPSVINPPSP
jgi:hypothetical protein